jgi:hypothetical protein
VAYRFAGDVRGASNEVDPEALDAVIDTLADTCGPPSAGAYR